jgi:Tfp pilus assembly protein PilE
MKKLNQKAFAPVEVLVVVLIMIVVAFIGFTAWQRSASRSSSNGADMVADALSVTENGRANWNVGQLGSVYSHAHQSTDGQVCVITDFRTTSASLVPSGQRSTYKWRIRERRGSTYVTVRTSSTRIADGNHDYECFDRSIVRGRYYKAEFQLITNRGYTGGKYLFCARKQNTSWLISHL